MFARFRFDAKRAREDDAEREAEQPAGAAVKAEETETEAAAADGPARRVRVKAEPQPEPAELPPVAAAAVGPKWQERWHAICAPCFEARRACDHHAERRLRLLIVGHNPSDHAWASGYSYSNPTNRFWSLLRGELPPLSWRGILPADAPLAEQNRLPSVYGVGMTSIGLEPGNDAASYGKETMTRWRNDFFRRLRLHVQRGCVAEHGLSPEDAPCALPHSPMLVAFSGKRQFGHLFSPPLAKVPHFGRQTRLPPGWPRECLGDQCEVWVLPSSSGRAAMTTAQRAEPYQQLAARFHELPWGPPAGTIAVKQDQEGDTKDSLETLAS